MAARIFDHRRETNSPSPVDLQARHLIHFQRGSQSVARPARSHLNAGRAYLGCNAHPASVAVEPICRPGFVTLAGFTCFYCLPGASQATRFQCLSLASSRPITGLYLLNVTMPSRSISVPHFGYSIGACVHVLIRLILLDEAAHPALGSNNPRRPIAPLQSCLVWPPMFSDANLLTLFIGVPTLTGGTETRWAQSCMVAGHGKMA